MMADDDNEVGLPQKGINMIIKDVLPDMRIANETRELLNQCCVEFVRHVSREAQQISSRDQRKTIYHDHVQKALKNLGFPREYVDAANSVLGECKIAAEKRLKRKNSRLDKCGIPEEQLWQMQQQLIEKARREEAEKQAANVTPQPMFGAEEAAEPSSTGGSVFFAAPSLPRDVVGAQAVDPHLERMFIGQHGAVPATTVASATEQPGADEEADEEEDYDI